MEELKPNKALIDYQFKVMEDKLDEHRDDTTKRFDRIESLIRSLSDSIKDTYATKEEHRANKERIDLHSAIISRIAWGTFF